MKFIIYQDNNYRWRWTLKDDYDSIIDASENDFASRAEAVEDARRKGYTGN